METMRDWLAVRAAEIPEAPFVETPIGRITYGEAEELVRRGAGSLRSVIEPGTLVAVDVRSDMDTVLDLWTIPRAGGVVVPISPRWPRDQRSATLERFAIEALPSIDRDGPVVEPGPVGRLRPHSVLFTSGSTGDPKGVVLTWGNLDAAAAASASLLGHGRGDRWLAVLPFEHIGGLSILTRSARGGGTVVLEPEFDAERAAEILSRVEYASFVPTMLRRILDTGGRWHGPLRAVLVGGGPIPRGLLDEATAAGIPAVATYGCTEATSQIATGTPGSKDRRVWPLPGIEVRIIGDDGVPRDPGEVGEVAVDGPTVSPGYLGAVPRSGPHRTGDIGVFDADGALSIVGRVDDLIVTGGENVHPATVERVLAAHPGIREVAVWGVPDATWGEVVVAAVVVEDGVEVTALEEWSKGRLAVFQRPRRWRVLDALPRTALGKVDRNRLEAL